MAINDYTKRIRDVSKRMTLYTHLAWAQQHKHMVEQPQSNTMAVEPALLATVRYGDLFDYPLTATEIHRYLVQTEISLDELGFVLDQSVRNRQLEEHGDFYTLPGRGQLVHTRRQRAQVAADLWREGVRFGHRIARLPFVRMVAVTGSMAVHNPSDDADIDYMIVTANRRLWLTRLLSLAIVKVAARQGVTLCPNFFVTERTLSQKDQTLYVARELAQMVPLHGYDVYLQLLQQNSWMHQFLPNARPMPAPSKPRKSLSKWFAERMLAPRWGDWLENWERERKIRKLSTEFDSAESRYSADMCKGHHMSHQARVMTAYDQPTDG